jgi:cell division transport system ATP-binding protein
MVQQLSGGEQQRLCIARAIVNDPMILLADEPTGNLNPEIAEEIFELLRKVNSWGTTVMMATHDIQLIVHSHHRRIVLEQGMLIRGGDATVKPKFTFQSVVMH